LHIETLKTQALNWAAPVTTTAPAAVNFQLIGKFRGVLLGQLQFYPVYATAKGWQAITYARVILEFNAPNAPSRPTVDPMVQNILGPTVLNADQLFAEPHTPKALTTAAPSVIITVDRSGLMQIPYATLTTLGLLPNDLSKVRLRQGGIEVPLEQDDAHQRFLFFADVRFNRYTATDGYTLDLGVNARASWPTRTASPTGLAAGTLWATTTAEQNLLYMPDSAYASPSLPAGRNGDRWMWDVFATHGTHSFTTTLTNVDTTRPATLTVSAVGYTDFAITPEHHFTATLNGNVVGSFEWDGKQTYTAQLNLPAGRAVNGVNTVQLTQWGVSGVGAWFDAFSVQYVPQTGGNALLINSDGNTKAYTLTMASTSGLRVYDVTTATQPISLTSWNLTGNQVSFGGDVGRYLVVTESGIQTPTSIRLANPLQATTVDRLRYVLIAPLAFTAALTPLVALRQSQGLTTAIENVQAVYDAYDDGRPTPNAIALYLRALYHAQDCATNEACLQYALLVGDGTADPRRYRASSYQTYIPPFLIDNADPEVGESAADNRYVTFDDGLASYEDVVPDLALGRLPVNSLAETQAVIQKIITYETVPVFDTWYQTLVFAADDADGFDALANDFISTNITSPFVATRAYYSSSATTPPLLSAAQVSTLVHTQWNNGAGLFVYTGHASNQQWSVERFFHYNDISGLTNTGRYPVVLEMTCFTGLFQEPAESALDEALVRQANTGAVAVWGASSTGFSSAHRYLAQGFLGSVYQNGNPILGQATLAGKMTLIPYGAHELVDTFTLFGDPALQLVLTSAIPAAKVYLPLIQR
jgi:hypothetical protein